MTLLAHHHARRRLALAGPPPLIWQQDKYDEISYGNGNWQPDYDPLYYGGSGLYALDSGARYAFTVPPGGYSRCIIEGLQNVNTTTYTVYRNGQPVFSGNAFANPARRGIYADIAVAAGDTIEVEFTGAGPNNYGAGGNNAIIADQLRFL